MGQDFGKFTTEKKKKYDGSLCAGKKEKNEFDEWSKRVWVCQSSRFDIACVLWLTDERRRKISRRKKNCACVINVGP